MRSNEQAEDVSFYYGLMPRKVVIRRQNLNTAIAQLEAQVRAEYKNIWKEHIEDLEAAAEWIQEDAKAITPVDKGKLQESINVRVSKSARYPGIIASASAKSKRGFDYALIQEENENFSHEEPGQAHYLSQPMYHILDDFFYEWTGKHLEIPEIPDREGEDE